MARKSIADWIRRALKDRRSRRQSLSVWVMEDLGLGYVALPKAASSAIRNLIRDREGQRIFADRELDRASLKMQVEKRVKHSLTPSEARAFGRNVRLFSFVRNPLTRLHSCYRDKVVNAAQKHERCTLGVYGIEFGMSFDEFVTQVSSIPDERADQHFRSQHTFLTHDDQLLVHFLGRFERFDEDWRRLGEEYGLPQPGRDHRVSGPPVSAQQLPLKRASAERAVQRYRRDIELFDYHQEIEQVLERL